MSNEKKCGWDDCEHCKNGVCIHDWARPTCVQTVAEDHDDFVTTNGEFIGQMSSISGEILNVFKMENGDLRLELCYFDDTLGSIILDDERKAILRGLLG